MNRLLAQVVSSGAGTWTEQRLEFDNLPRNWAAVLTVAVVAGACYWVLRTYRAELRAGSSPAARTGLALLRCAVLLLLALIWLQPSRTPYRHQHVESHTLLLVDHSASMSIADHYREPSDRARLDDFLQWAGHPLLDRAVPRQELLGLLLRDTPGGLLDGLARRNRVEVFGFAERLTPLATIAARRDPVPAESRGAVPPAPALPPWGPSTDLGGALRQAIDGLGGAPLAGIVVLSDGQINRGEPVDVLGDVARALDAPIFTLGIGEPAAPRNVRVEEWTGPADAFVGDPVELTARLRATGLAGDSVVVELQERLLDSGSDTRTTVATQTLVVAADGVLDAVRFTREPARPGRIEYTLNVVPHPDEPVRYDNSAQLSTQVIENKLRVLLVSGEPGWTYRFITRLLERDKTIDLSTWLQSADRTAVRDGNTVIEQLPATPAELFVYDVIILLDPDARSLPAEWPALVDQHVERNGAGLVFSAGRQHTPALFRDLQMADLVALLPVVPDPDAELLLNQVGYYQKLGAAVEFGRQALAHSVFGGDAEGEAAAVYRQIVQVYWHYPVKHEKATATVLMRHGHPRMRNAHGGHVLMATQFIGAGRTAWLGFDGTWRWRRYGEEYFNRFWIQVVRHVAEGRLTGGGGRGRIQTDKDWYRVGERVELRARLTDPRYRPLEAREVGLELQSPDGGVVQLVLQADPGRPGTYAGQFVPDAAGDWVARVSLEGDAAAAPVALGHGITVRQADLEFQQTRLDAASLALLSERSAGGRYFELDQAAQLADAIADRHERHVRRGTPVPLWDRAWMLGLLIGLLCVEWALRKKMQLL